MIIQFEAPKPWVESSTKPKPKRLFRRRAGGQGPPHMSAEPIYKFGARWQRTGSRTLVDARDLYAVMPMAPYGGSGGMLWIDPPREVREPSVDWPSGEPVFHADDGIAVNAGALFDYPTLQMELFEKLNIVFFVDPVEACPSAWLQRCAWRARISTRLVAGTRPRGLGWRQTWEEPAPRLPLVGAISSAVRQPDGRRIDIELALGAMAAERKESALRGQRIITSTLSELYDYDIFLQKCFEFGHPYECMDVERAPDEAAGRFAWRRYVREVLLTSTRPEVLGWRRNDPPADE